MLNACCGNSHFKLTESNTCHITELFILFLGDQITDLIVLSHWYRYGYHAWFICGSTVVGVSWIMQWLYSTWNCNDYLQNLLKRRHVSSDHLTPPKCCGSSLTKTILTATSNLHSSSLETQCKRDTHIEQWKKTVYLTDNTDDDEDDDDDLLDITFNDDFLYD
eukprot:275944_1